MNRLLMMIAALTGIAVSSILTPSLEEKTAQIQIVREVEVMLNHAQFSDSELAWMDQLSQKFPQSANAFQKLYALEKMNPNLSPDEYQALYQKYRARFVENRAQAKSLLDYVSEARLKGDDQHPIKVLASRIGSESELHSRNGL